MDKLVGNVYVRKPCDICGAHTCAESKNICIPDKCTADTVDRFGYFIYHTGETEDWTENALEEMKKESD